MQGNNPAIRLLKLLDAAICRFEETVLASSILIMAAVSVANVIGRNAFSHSLTWATEINQILLVLITFIGIGYGARKARHIRMSALYDPLPMLLRKALMIVTSLGTAALLFLLAFHAVDYVQAARAMGSVSPALELPLYLVYLWVPAGFVLGGIQYLMTAFANLVEPRVQLAFGIEEPGTEARPAKPIQAD